MASRLDQLHGDAVVIVGGRARAVLHERHNDQCMVLAGFVIALGDIVDDAIIGIENVVRRLRQHRLEGTPMPLAKVILDGVARSAKRDRLRHADRSLRDHAGVLPARSVGCVFRPLAMAYALALLVSMIVALTVTPALGLSLPAPLPVVERESPIVGWLKRNYERILAPIVRSPRPAYAVVGVLAVTGAVIWPLLGNSFFRHSKNATS